MKKILLLLTICLASIYCCSQEVQKLTYDIKALEGTWLAKSGTKSYEITFEKQILYLEPLKTRAEGVVGSIKYLENNIVIRTVNMDGFESPINVYFRDLNKFRIHYSEKYNETKIFGIAYFDINSDGKTARWYNLFKRQIPESTKDTFDIPKELIFTKK
ncbi:DUF6705 family protein [Dysgonomonas sp.]